MAAITYRTSGAENDGSTAVPALARSVFTGLAAGETILVALNHTGVANASAPTSPFVLIDELVAPTSAESSLHVYIGKSADWTLEAASFVFPISIARGGCLLQWVIPNGDVELAAVVSSFNREVSATPTIALHPDRDGSLLVCFSGAKPASGTISGAAGGAGYLERQDMSVSATSFLHTQTLDQAVAALSTAAPTFGGVSASYAQALVVMAAPLPAGPLESGGSVDPGQWALEVVDQDDATPRGMLEPQTFRVTMRLDAAGELSASLLASSPGAGALEVYSRVVRAWRRPRGDPAAARILRFAGHVHQLADAGDADGNETVSFTARDPFAAFERRYMWTDNSYATAAVPAALNAAVTYLVGEAVLSEETGLGSPASYPHGLSVLAVGAGWPSGYWVWSRHQPMGEAFRQLQEGEAGTMGFHWTVKPSAAGPLHGAMWISITPAGLSAVSVTGVLEYGAGTVANLASYALERVPPINGVIAIGEDALWHKNDSETSGATYGLWPVLVSYPDVDTDARLDALARGVWNVFPTDSIAVELADVDPDGHAPEAPMLWDDFEIGDSLPVYIRGARRTVTGTALVREATVTVDAEGTERLASLVLELPSAS